MSLLRQPIKARGATIVDYVHKNHPPSFFKTKPSKRIRKWLAEMEHIFQYCKTPKERNVTIASEILEGNAYEWWIGVEDEVTDGWNNFKTHIEAQYKPQQKTMRVDY